jgi:hypothetical protein
MALTALIMACPRRGRFFITMKCRRQRSIETPTRPVERPGGRHLFES